MAEDGNGFNRENGSSKNQTSTSDERRRASKEANHVWAPFKRRKAPRGNPEAACRFEVRSVSEASSSKSMQKDECYTILFLESAFKELESLAVHMPDVSDSDACKSACSTNVLHRGVQRNVSTDAQTNVSQMFLVCSRTVKRWVELWESTGEEALLMVAAQLKKVIHQSFSPVGKYSSIHALGPFSQKRQSNLNK